MAHRYKFLKMNNCIDVMRDDDDAIYKSLIQEVKGSGLVIQEPTYRRFVMPLKPDQRVKVTVYSPDYKHCFDATVTEARNENSLVKKYAANKTRGKKMTTLINAFKKLNSSIAPPD